MKDRFGRRISYMRVSVTDRCNMRCVYCLPESGVSLRPHAEILSYEEIAVVLEEAASLGISTVRFTGGEPLVRKGLIPFISRVSGIPGIERVALTTNGALLAGRALELRRAGVSRINVSIDSLRPERFRAITRTGELEPVRRGLDAALAAGFEAVKLNVVVVRGTNDDELPDFARLALDAPLHVRFIELMPLGQGERASRAAFVPAGEMVERLRGEFALEPDAGPAGAGPARYFRVRPPRAGPSRGTVGFITAMSEHFCGACNRLRLTADGRVNPCLASHEALDLKRALRGEGGRPDARSGVRAILERAALSKPERHAMRGGGDDSILMSRVGG